MTDHDIAFSVEQRARAEALQIAHPLVTGTAGLGRKAADPEDLIRVARWIITGVDPAVLAAELDKALADMIDLDAHSYPAEPRLLDDDAPLNQPEPQPRGDDAEAGE